MNLSSFEDARILSVDYRYQAEKDRLLSLLEPRGVKPRFFIDGAGDQLPRKLYNQIRCMPPNGWRDGVGSYSHFRAFKSMITEAKNANRASLLIAEDDLTLTDEFDEIVGKAEVPSDWDMIYYGANHTDSGTRDVAPHVLRCFGSKTTHLVAFRDTIYDDVLSLPEDRTIDWSIGQRLHEKYNCYAIWPSVALQMPGYSHLWKRSVDYSRLWKNKGNPV